jgi:transposase
LMNEHDGEGLSARMRMLVADIRAQWQDLDRRIGEFEAEFVRWAKENEDARRLVTISGVGVTISTALIAAVGKAETFEHAIQIDEARIRAHLGELVRGTGKRH